MHYDVTMTFLLWSTSESLTRSDLNRLETKYDYNYEISGRSPRFLTGCLGFVASLEPPLKVMWVVYRQDKLWLIIVYWSVVVPGNRLHVKQLH